MCCVEMARVFIIAKPSILSCILLFICIAVLIRESNARPPWLASGSGVFTESVECHTDAAFTASPDSRVQR
ncbi:uncharacterized protein ACR2FA_009011 isoform 2-T2 [Aphomia sociella]